MLWHQHSKNTIIIHNSKMQKRLGVKEWINIHKAYWKNPNIPNENIEQYDKRFVALVENCLK